MRSLSFIGRRVARVATQTSFLLSIAMIAMLWIGIALKYQDQADGDYRDTILTNRNLALLFEENVLRSVREVDNALLYLRHQIGQERSGALLHAILSDAPIISEVMEQVAIADAQGTLVAIKSQASIPHRSISDRDYFQRQQTSSADTLYIGHPVVGRVTGRWLVPLSRRLTNADGSFAGVVLASLNQKHFVEFYQSIDLGQSGSISLIGLDGYVRFSGGSGGRGRLALGQDMAGTPLLRAIRDQKAGTFVDSTPNGKRIVTFRRVRDLPLAVSVSVTERQVYADAHRDVLRHAVIGAVLTFLILGVGIKGSRDQLRLRLAKAKLLHSQRQALQKSEHLALTLDSMGQGIILVTSDFRIPVINQHAIELLELPDEFLRSSPTFIDLVKFQEKRGEYTSIKFPEGVSVLEYFTQRDGIGGLRTFERTRPNGTVLEVRSTALPDGGFVRTFTDVTRRREAQDAVLRLSSEDALTGLANRRHFREEVEKRVLRLKARQTSGDEEEELGFALLSLDLDWFKIVNETQGHWIGDALLQQVADRLKSTVRADALVARLGGDEFGVLLPGTCSTEQPEALAIRLGDMLSQPYEIYGQHTRIGASIGIALAPHDGSDAELLLRASDMALYAAKAAGRGTYRFFHKNMAEQLRVKHQLELDLRNAIDNGQLALHYQPVLNTADKTISGFEALMRWDHPMRGMVAPSEFIPIAEQTGLIVSLGSWAIRKACEQATEWPANLNVAVNVSPMQFRTGCLVSTVSEVLRETGLSPGRLQLEITETILMQESDSTVHVLHQLRDLGVRISMDDFGTGYSSLSYLRSFPLDKIKIDRAFVKDLGVSPASDVIIRSVIDIATTLNMTTTAEGVETREQFERLSALGCGEAQGYYLSKAVPVTQVPELIAKWSTRKSIAA